MTKKKKTMIDKVKEGVGIKPKRITTTESVTKTTIEEVDDMVVVTTFIKEDDMITVISNEVPKGGFDTEREAEEAVEELLKTIQVALIQNPGLKIVSMPADMKQLTRYQVNKIKQFDLL